MTLSCLYNVTKCFFGKILTYRVGGPLRTESNKTVKEAQAAPLPLRAGILLVSTSQYFLLLYRGNCLLDATGQGGVKQRGPL